MRHFIALGAFSAAFAGPLSAQDQGEGGMQVIFETSTRVEANDNFALSTDNPEGGTIATQSLGFSLFSETRTETFAFGLGTVYQLGTVPGTRIGSGFRDPSASLAYSRESIGASLDVSAQFQRQELGLGRVLTELEELEDEIILPSDLIEDLGKLDRVRSDTQLEFGREGPLGLTLGAAYDLRDYSSTTNADLYDRETIRLTSDFRLDLSPSLQMHLQANHIRYDAEDLENTSRDTSQLGVQFDARLDASQRLTARLSHDSVKTRETIGGLRQETTDSGISSALGYARDLPAGEIRVNVATDFSTTGRRNSLTFGRALDLPLARLDMTVGATSTSEGVRAIGRLNYALDLPRGSLTAKLERSARTTGEDQAILQTVASVAHSTQINNVSAVNVGINYARVTGLSNTADDVWRGSVTASYNHALTRDWALNVGVTHTREDNAASNALFVSLGRQITLQW